MTTEPSKAFYDAVATRVSPEPGRTVCLMRVGKTWVLGQNDRQKTSPAWTRKYDNGEVRHTRHAETHALQLAEREGGKVTHVVVMRFNRHGGLAMAKPCRHCHEALNESGIKDRTIYYSDWDGVLRSLHHDSD